MASETEQALLKRIRDMEARLEEAEETLRALRSGEVDAVVVSGPDGDRVYTLKGADEAYRIILENMGEGALTVTQDGLILFSNERFAAMFGMPLERVLGTSIQGFIAAEDAPALSAILAEANGRAAEVRLKKGPVRVPVQLSANKLRLDGTECVCLIVTDLTEHERLQEIQRAEERARESEARLRSLGDNLPEGAIYRSIRDAKGELRFEFISAGIERLTGVPAAEIMRDAAAMERTLVPEDLARLQAARDVSCEHLTRLEVEVRNIHCVTGETRWSLLRSMPSCQPDGSTLWEGIQFDITDRKRAEEELRAREDQLRQAQKLESIGVLAGGIAHDFNNLLTGVLGNASLVLDVMPNWDPNRPAIESLMESANRAADLTRQMLAYAGKGRFIVRPVDVSKTVRQMVTLLRGSVPAIIELDFELQEEIAAVNADEGQIQQIILNLVQNAGEAIGDRPGRVVIQTQTRSVDAAVIEQSRLDVTPGPYVSLEVKDNGPGIDDATKARIFEPFFTTKFTGRGLGLAAVHGIVRAHQGAVIVSGHPGNGAQFTVLLPVASSAAEPKAEITEKAQNPHGHGTILVVDDEKAVWQVAKKCLERFGYRVLVAQNGVEAVEVFGKAPDQVTAVLLDLTMPLMSGAETLPRLRAIRPDIPVLLSSGYNQAEVIKQFAGQSLPGFVAKPYSCATLVARIKAVCDGSSA